MANQIIVTQSGNVQVSIEPPANVQVQISRAAIGTVSNVPTANFANYAANVTSSSQPNITSLGTLTGLTVSGNSTVNNLTVAGNLVAGNLVANTANFANFAGEAFNVSGSNVTGEVANAAYANNANTANSATVANTANSVALANVSGAGNIASINLDGNVANLLTGLGTFVAIPTVSANANYANFANIANTANSVAVANVSGIGNIATVNLDGNASNILFGNGIFSAIPAVSNVANANYANFAGTAFSVSGSNVSGAVANATYADNAGNANLANLATFATTANSVAGANVSGTVANANYSAFANIAASANSVAVANVSGIGNIATVNLDGSSSNVLFGNGVFAPESTSIANANYANFAGTAFNVSGSNVSGEVANAAYANIAGVANSVAGANVSGEVANAAYANNANTANLATFATTANAVAGANVSGAVAYATVANSVSVGNVSGIGNISTINIDGNLGNVLYGNGVFAAVVAPTSVANANYANFAGTAFSVSGSNVSGEVANAAYANAANTANTANLATFATTANSVAGANVSGTVANATFALDAGNSNLANTANSVAVANVSGIGNIATVNLDGNASNILYGNGVFATTPIISNVANANYANFAGTAFSVSGSNVSGEVANAAYANAANTANLATFATTANAVAGANVSGTVANANFASYANIASSANSVALANVSGIGNIANINLDGSSSNVLFGNGVFAPESTSIANANYANFAGTAFNVSGSNVSGEVANANYASYANVANTANSVAVGNVSGIGNIATINLDGNASNALLGNGSFGPVEVQSTSIANGTSNINIPVANGAIAVSVNNVANLMLLENAGLVNAFPTSSTVNMLRINTFNNPLSDAHRVAWARARGTNASPTSVQANDRLGILSFFGHNGTSYQTNSVGFIRATVDSSYTANGANIPIGMQVLVNDTNGGINNQTKTHNFYANGSVSLVSDLSAGGNLLVTGTGQVNGNLQTNNITVYPNPLSTAQANVSLYNGNVDVANNGSGTGGWVNTINLRGPANSFGALGSNGYLYGNTIRAIGAISSDDIMRLPGAGTANITLYASNGNIVTSGTVSANAANVANLTVTGVSNLGSNSNVVITGGSAGYALTTDGSGNLSWSSVASNASSIANGTSNVSIPSANGSIAFSANNVANVVLIENGGFVNAFPTSSIVNMLRINTFNNSLSDAHRIAWARARGSNTSPTSVQANDRLGILGFFGHNGTSYQTNSISFIRATVDSSYSANTANIPIGLQFIVNDTNGGINNQAKTHNFYANGAVNIVGNLYSANLNTGEILSGNITAYQSSISAGNVILLTLDNNSTQAIQQSTYNNANIQTGAWTSWRHRGTTASPLPVQAGDEISKFSSVVRADSGNTYYNAAEQIATVISNDGSGNVATDYRVRVYNSGSKFSVMAPKLTVADSNDFGANATIYANGYISTVDRLDYLRTFGSFTSNVTQTNSNVGNAVYMTLNNNEGSNGVSIVSNSQITTSRTGNYNIQFSAQMEKTDAGTDAVEIWLTKNGSAVANSATRLQIQGTNEKDVAAWNWLVNSANVNDYYQIAWASTDANMQLVAIGSGSTLSGVAVPSLIVTVVPVGA